MSCRPVDGNSHVPPWAMGDHVALLPSTPLSPGPSQPCRRQVPLLRKTPSVPWSPSNCQCATFWPCQRALSEGLSAHPFANSFLFLILAVSVKVASGAATISSLPSSLPPPPPIPSYEQVFLVCASVGDPLVLSCHVRVFSQRHQVARRWSVKGGG